MEERASPLTLRRRMASSLHWSEHVLYVGVGVALTVAAVALFVDTVVNFVDELGDQAFSSLMLEVLDGLLLVFIVTELLHTVRAIIAENVLATEPFLIVGIIAAIRRVIVISAEAADVVGEPRFDDLMIEMVILVGAVFLIGVTIFLLRHTEHSEPRPSHEPAPDS